MIPRYSRPAMEAIWSDESRFRIWLDIEIHACDAQAKLGVIPEEAASVIREKAISTLKKFTASNAKPNMTLSPS